LVKVVKENGLVCVSYGTLNNDNIMVQVSQLVRGWRSLKIGLLTMEQRQVKEGIDAVIVDSVLAIRKGLTTSSAEAAEKTNGVKEEVEDAISGATGAVI
jgi:glycerophosphodiester phosphodiesterase